MGDCNGDMALITRKSYTIRNLSTVRLPILQQNTHHSPDLVMDWLDKTEESVVYRISDLHLDIKMSP